MQPSFVYLHYFRSPLTFTSKEMYPLEKCQMFYTSRSQLNIKMITSYFFKWSFGPMFLRKLLSQTNFHQPCRQDRWFSTTLGRRKSNGVNWFMHPNKQSSSFSNHTHIKLINSKQKPTVNHKYTRFMELHHILN